MSTTSLSQRWARFQALRISLSAPFRFKDLPIEIALRILSLAITTPAQSKTYRSLVRVSRELRALALEACLPHVPVVLLSLSRFQSFCAFLDSHPTVRPHIQSVWFVAGIRGGTERTLGLEIFQKCPHMARIACNINLLHAIIGDPSGFSRPRLKDLTLVEPRVSWRELLQHSAGRQLFSQVTHLRIAGGTQFEFDLNFSFTSLTHLSFACHSLTWDPNYASPFDSVRFPVLQRIVPSMPYFQWRMQDPATVQHTGRMVDHRMDVITCPRKWSELDVWEQGVPGESDLWERARTTDLEFLQGVSAPDYFRHPRGMGGSSLPQSQSLNMIA